MTNKMPVVGKRYRHKRLEKEVTVQNLYVSFDKPEFNFEELLRFWDNFEELPEDNLQEKKEVGEVERALEAEKRPSIKYVHHLESQIREMKEAFERSAKEKDMSKPEPIIKYSKIGDKAIAHYHSKKIESEQCSHIFTTFIGTVRMGTLLVEDGVCPDCKQEVFRCYDRETRLKGEIKETTIDAINSCHMTKPEPEIDIKEECVDPVSIWKPISQLNKNENNDLLIRRSDKKILLGEHLLGVLYDYNKDGDFCTLTDFINSFEQMQKDIEELKRK